MIDWDEYLKLFVALLAIVDVPGNVPMFLQQTSGFDAWRRNLTAITAGLATAVILMAFAFQGDVLLEAFGITIEAFKILGGIVILLIALDMLGLLGDHEEGGTERRPSHPVAVGIFPMAVPLFAGPGAISMMMVYAHRDFHSDHDLIVGLLAGAVSAAIVLGLLMASVLSRLITPLMQSVLNRLLGIIVGALGVEFILEGIADFFSLGL